jgi:hypothetical protein
MATMLCGICGKPNGRTDDDSKASGEDCGRGRECNTRFAVQPRTIKGLSAGYRRELAAWIDRVNATEWAPVKATPLAVETVAVGPAAQVEMFWQGGSLRLVDGAAPEADRLVAALGVRELPCAPIVLLTQRKAA